jgi:hypothetical protein
MRDAIAFLFFAALALGTAYVARPVVTGFSAYRCPPQCLGGSER